MSPETVLKLADKCDGWGILCPDALRAIGLPDSLAGELTDVFESDPSDGRSTIYVDDRPVNQLRGINGLALLRRLAEIAGADCSGVNAVGRGTLARQYQTAIRDAVMAKEVKHDER